MNQVLSIAVQSADYRLSNAEAQLAGVEAEIRKADASVAALRAIALNVGLQLSEAPNKLGTATEFLSRTELATRMGISVRRVDQHRTRMKEGLHYHKDGARVLFHYPEAVDFILTLLARKAGTDDAKQHIESEISRRLGKKKPTKSPGDSGR